MTRLTFTNTDLAGKKMIVQATNSGTDLAADQFDIAMRKCEEHHAPAL